MALRSYTAVPPAAVETALRFREGSLTDEESVARLAMVLDLGRDRLDRHLIRPLGPSASQPHLGWVLPKIVEDILAITDGFILFGPDPWNGFRLWGSADYLECTRHGGPIAEQAMHDGLLPIFGEIPHLTSISVPDGTVVATDWEVYDRPEHGWRKDIAADLKDYIRTVIGVREAYGDEDEFHSDWWRPYASHGTRLDRPA
jgi:hypothetical protein